MSTHTFDSLPALAVQIAERFRPLVVALGRDWRGTGLVVAEGFVLTNAHNLRNRTIQVTFADGRVLQGTVHGIDADGDLAVIAVATGAHERPKPEPGTAPVGTAVFALTPLVGSDPRLSFGTVSSTGRTFRGPRGRTIHGSIEHTAPLPRGASGGPIVGLDGALLGINTHRLGNGLYLALPYDAALIARINALLAGASVERRKLGVAIASAETKAQLRASVGLDDAPGLLVRKVDAAGVAATAGIRTGDLIVAVDSVAVDDAAALEEALQRSVDEHRASVDVGIVRGTASLAITVSFDNGDSAEAKEPTTEG